MAVRVKIKIRNDTNGREITLRVLVNGVLKAKNQS